LFGVTEKLTVVLAMTTCNALGLMLPPLAACTLTVKVAEFTGAKLAEIVQFAMSGLVV
jgi:hypothetical protein